MTTTTSEERRFDEKVVVTPRGCKLWVGAFRRGEGNDYPVFRASGKNVYARTWAWERVYGPVLPGKRLVNQCGDRRCVNPWHHTEGTAVDAAAQRKARGGYVVRRGTVRRVNALDAARMFALRAAGHSIAVVARMTGFCVRTAQYVLAGHRAGAPEAAR